MLKCGLYRVKNELINKKTAISVMIILTAIHLDVKIAIIMFVQSVSIIN